MKNRNSIPHARLCNVTLIILLLLAGCNSIQKSQAVQISAAAGTLVNIKPADVTGHRNIDAPGIILSREQVPILCYHQIREWRSTDSKTARDYIVPESTFREQMKMLSDSGYHTILPDELISYLERGEKLPAKPIMLTFDDTDLSQFTTAQPELEKSGFKGVFFIMTVSLNRRGYMSSDQVKELSDKGNVIGSHTWDHHNVKKYTAPDWIIQVEKPTIQLEKITGVKVKYFAFPFGLWSSTNIPELKKRGFSGAFQLATKRDASDPLFTIRRIIVPGAWSGNRLAKAIEGSFR
jgi:peptidoglycan/xylan/chitin deacetylase (PgdA/CDA1 family)